MKRYNNRLKDLRETKNLTQQEIADKMYLQVTQYRRYENGEYDLPLEWAKKFANFYNVSIDYIANLIPTPKLLEPTQQTALVGLTPKEQRLLQNYYNSEFQRAVDKLLEI